MTARGIRNNNCGNIRYLEGVTSKYVGCTGSDGAFCIFDTPEHGIRALGRLLLSYQDRHGIRTIHAAIDRWAPPVENNTAAYIAAVAKSVGVGPDDELDFHQPEVLEGIGRAICVHENGSQPYSDATWKAGIGAALGITAPVAPESGTDRPVSTRIPEPPPTPPAEPAPPPERKRMDPLTLISVFGPILSNLIPQVAKLFGGGSEVATRNVATASLVLDTVTKAAGAANVQQAVEKMQADPALAASVQAAVVTEPGIMALLEVGGGIAVARTAAADPGQISWWKNPAVIVTGFLLPALYIVICSVMFDWGRGEWSDEIRTMVVTAVVSGLLGSVTGFFLGSSMGSQKKTDQLAAK